VFEHLSEYSRIAVTGPQRSGTTVAAKMIAADTGHRFVDEFEFAITDVEAWRRLVAMDGVVVQCPHMLKRIVDQPPTDVLVVLMRRPIEEIHASASRIGWYSDWGNETELEEFGVGEGDSALLKYEYWDSHEKHFPHLELPYSSLQPHPMYRAPELRKDFGAKQTE
jgi:hypothetical protein